MMQSIQNIFKIPDLRKKILFTLAMVVIYRFGVHIPVPGVNPAAVKALIEGMRGTVFGLFDIFVGGALSRASILALGVMPYISASIMFQLLGFAYPKIQKMQQDEEGRRKINQYTRYLTVFIGAMQALAISVFLQAQGPIDVGGQMLPLVLYPGMLFRLTTVVSLTAGTIFLMWIGELITEKGIGNGISFLIFVGCVETIPSDFERTVTAVRTGSFSFFASLVLIGIIIVMFGAMVLITQAMRKIPVQYPRRIVGRRVYGGQSTFIPLRINTAGVIPIIFAQSIIMIPGTFSSFIRHPIAQQIENFVSPGNLVYDLTFGLLIIFCTYFYTSVVFNPQDIANNMKRYGGFIPGIRPGQKTAEYFDSVLSKITLPGGIFLAFIALLPWWLMQGMNVPFYFGGTTYLIIVGVSLDIIQQIQSHLLMRSYEGLLKGMRVRGRR